MNWNDLLVTVVISALIATIIRSWLGNWASALPFLAADLSVSAGFALFHGEPANAAVTAALAAAAILTILIPLRRDRRLAPSSTASKQH